MTTLLAATDLPSGATSTQTPYAQMEKVIYDANAAVSVRVVTSLTSKGVRLVTLTNASQTGGLQTVTLTEAGKSNSVTIELLAGILYVKGDYTMLTSYLALSKSNATKFANKWFTISAGNVEYEEVGQGLTISSVMDQVTMTPSVVARAPTTMSGKKVDVLSGMTVKTALDPSISVTLYYSSAKTPLPIEVTGSPQGSKAVILFSHWGEKVKLVAPKATLQLT
jgi:hypothetical protein